MNSLLGTQMGGAGPYMTHLAVMLDAGTDADVDELLTGHTDGGAGLDDARLHTHTHHNGVPAYTWLMTTGNYNYY